MEQVKLKLDKKWSAPRVSVWAPPIPNTYISDKKNKIMDSIVYHASLMTLESF